MSQMTVGLLRQLSETPGTSGDEGAVRDLIARTLRGHVDHLEIDRMGNLIAHKRGTGAASLRVAVAAHMDEVGLMIVGFDKNGLLRVADSGGVNGRTLLGKAVQVGPDRLPGVICNRPVHFSKKDDADKVPGVDDLVIDIGASSDTEAKAKVKIGQRITFRTSFGFLGPERVPDDSEPLPARGRIKGKAFDDRTGCAALIALLLGEPLPCDLIGVFTVQEEVGMRGALVAGSHVAPDAAFILEGTVCDDLPLPSGSDEKRSPTTRLGDGPAITQRDGSHVVPPFLLQYLLRTAAAHNIPYQFKIPNVGGTDAAAFAQRRSVPVGILSTPCRYIHGPVAVAELSDFHNLLALLRAALATLHHVPGIIAQPAPEAP